MSAATSFLYCLNGRRAGNHEKLLPIQSPIVPRVMFAYTPLSFKYYNKSMSDRLWKYRYQSQENPRILVNLLPRTYVKTTVYTLICFKRFLLNKIGVKWKFKVLENHIQRFKLPLFVYPSVLDNAEFVKCVTVQ